jgi:hypothetical protein
MVRNPRVKIAEREGEVEGRAERRKPERSVRAIRFLGD